MRSDSRIVIGAKRLDGDLCAVEPARGWVVFAHGIVLQEFDESTPRNDGCDAASCAYGDMLDMGVIDPAKVTRLALQNAASIASLTLAVDRVVANAPKKAVATAVPSEDEY